MRSYGQYCSVAKALELIGDRWNLLIVRELLLRGPCRYTDLLQGLPGIATNMLAARLAALAQAGVLVREQAPPPVATAVFRLTARGRELGPVLRELGRWGAPLMAAPGEEGEFRAHWLKLPVELFLHDREPDGPAIEIELRAGEEPITICAERGGVTTRTGAADDPQLTISGSPRPLLGLISGALGPDAAAAHGVRCDGDLACLTRLRPQAQAQSRTAGG